MKKGGKVSKAKSKAAHLIIDYINGSNLNGYEKKSKGYRVAAR